MRAYSVVLFKLCMVVTLCVLSTWGGQLYAQQRQITGVVSDQDNFALPGAAVMVEGTSVGTMADEKGAFTIKADPGQVLIVSFIGFTDKKVPVMARLRKISGLKRWLYE